MLHHLALFVAKLLRATHLLYQTISDLHLDFLLLASQPAYHLFPQAAFLAHPAHLSLVFVSSPAPDYFYFADRSFLACPARPADLVSYPALVSPVFASCPAPACFFLFYLYFLVVYLAYL